MKISRTTVAWGLVFACTGGVAQGQAARLADGTAVHVRLTADLVSAQAAVSGRVDMEIAQPLALNGVVVIPTGSPAWGAVQLVKKGKVLHFDVEGVRLPNQQVVKLRVSPQKTTNVGKDEIKVETKVGEDLGARKGREFTAYLDQDVNVDDTGGPMPPTQSARVAEPAAPPASASPGPTPIKAPVTTPQAVSAPVSPGPDPAAHPAAPEHPGEYVTVECFSEPSGADIQIDEEYHGSTPSILKLPPGNHQIEFRLAGYRAHSQPLDLTAGTGLHTVRMILEKQP